jgi:hypothetical protein
MRRLAISFDATLANAAVADETHNAALRLLLLTLCDGDGHLMDIGHRLLTYTVHGLMGCGLSSERVSNWVFKNAKYCRRQVETRGRS